MGVDQMANCKLLSRTAVQIGTATSAISILFAAPGASAQATAPASDPEETVVVTGTRPIIGSQRAAISAQRNAENLVSVIAADTVGQFPDQNAAAALSRLPSVAVQRDQGQERYLQIRGAPNRWTSVSVDGINVIGADEAGNQRAFRFDAVPSVILSQLEVNKSLTSDLSAEAVVARVNLRTYSPFDRKGLNISGDLGYGLMELGEGPQQQASIRASWSGETFGFIAAASHYQREQITDNREFTYNLAEGRPVNLDYRVYNLVRASNGGILGAEWRPDDANRVFWKSIYTEFTDNEERNQYVFQGGGAVSGTRTAEAGDLVGVGVRGTFNDGYYDNWNLLHTIGGDHRLAGWDVEWRLNRTEIENTTDLPIVLSQQTAVLQRPSVRYDRSNPELPTLSLATTVAGTTPGTFVRGADVAGLTNSNFALNLLLPLSSITQAVADIVKIDFGNTITLGGVPVDVQFGSQLDMREVDGALLSGSAPTVNLTSLLPQVGRSFSFATYNTGRPWTTNFPAGTFLPFVDNKAMRRDLDGHLAALQTAGLYNPANNISPTDRFVIEEDILAAYGRASWDMGPARIVAGVRMEQADQVIEGFIRAGTVVTPLTVEKSDTDFFPSLNVRIEVGDNMLVRGAVQRSISRPSFGTVRAGASISDISGTISGGNPNLLPEYTWGFDGAWEYYIPGGGLFSVTGFVRQVENVLYTAARPVTDDTYDTPGFDRTGYRLTSEQNGNNGDVRGLEIAWQQQFTFLPGLLGGFGFQGNVTFLDGSFQTREGQRVGFPGTSDKVINAGIFYERDGLSTRLSYQWRDTWIDTLSSLGSGEFRKGYENLDFTARYSFNERFALFLDVSNITDETYIAFEGEERFPSEVEQIGRRWLAGLRFNF
jgi:TonB-dependent receptor